MECMICKRKCNDKLILKDTNIINKEGLVVEWRLCNLCFNLWANKEYGKLSKRIKKWKKAQLDIKL